jgi:hypothetical protein
LNVQKKKRKDSKKSQNSGADWMRSTDLWIKNLSPNRLSYEGLAANASAWQENIYIAIVITKVQT